MCNKVTENVLWRRSWPVKGWVVGLLTGVIFLSSRAAYADNPSFGTPYLVKDIRPGLGSSSPSHLAPAGDLVYFEARTDTEDKEPWVTDGTEAGTFLLKDINPDDDSDPVSFMDVNGVAFFFGNRDRKLR